MIIKKLVDNVYINGVPARVGTPVKPYDMVDARQGVVEFEDGTTLSYVSTRLVDTGLEYTTKEVVVKPEITDAVTTKEVTETKPKVTTKTTK